MLSKVLCVRTDVLLAFNCSLSCGHVAESQKQMPESFVDILLTLLALRVWMDNDSSCRGTRDY